ncbi:MAG: hypothetical protein JEY91_14810 [Spirochaetaceae bacterium]|nr:hypothetical protein [Spirochaetaceae bacterium]
MIKETNPLKILALFTMCILILFSCRDKKENGLELQKEKTGKRVLLINSYHQDYFWTAGITEAIEATLNSEDSPFVIDLEIIYMDTKRHPSEDFIRERVIEINSFIKEWSPDLVMTSDDNAARYLIVPHLIDTSLPVVFCGVNWDASEYGFPASNVTGMVEVQLIDQIVNTLAQYSNGNRIAFLKGDDFSARKEAAFFEERFDLDLIQRFVKDFDEWQVQYERLQDEADILLLGNTASISDWDKDRALVLVHKVTKIPSGNWDESMAEFNLVTFATKAEEQGEWVANRALEILSGMDPKDIPIVENEKAKIFLNMNLAKKLGIVFPIDLIDQAFFVE